VPPSAQIFDTEALATYFPGDFAQVDLRESLRGFWESCSPDQRELLRLYYGDGLTLAEISAILSRNLNTVKYQFYRAHEEASRTLRSSMDVLLKLEAK
jgi:DNA-directed RNA polymerase specialized sigma24 family protein